jgi:hypothetical protein
LRFRNPWDSEAEIADATRAALESLGWEVHPECGGWDLLAVARKVKVPWYGDLRPGDTLGIECKLDAGTVTGLESLLRQTLWSPVGDLPFDKVGTGLDRQQARDKGEALPSPPVVDFMRPMGGPHFRAVVAARISGLETWKDQCVLTVTAAIRESHYDAGTGVRVIDGWRRLTAEEFSRSLDPAWGSTMLPRREPQSPPRVPKVVVDVPAGVPSPQTSSPWKVAAVEVMLKLRAGEPMTSAEIQAMGINPRRLIDTGCIVDSGQRRGRAYLWTAGDGHAPYGREGVPPDLRWPEIAEALRRKGVAA